MSNLCSQGGTKIIINIFFNSYKINKKKDAVTQNLFMWSEYNIKYFAFDIKKRVHIETNLI